MGRLVDSRKLVYINKNDNTLHHYEECNGELLYHGTGLPIYLVLKQTLKDIHDRLGMEKHFELDDRFDNARF